MQAFADVVAPRQSNACIACLVPTLLCRFSVAFKPIVDLEERRIDSYEALVRGPTGCGAAEVRAQVNAENFYAFDQACWKRAIELAVRLGIDRQLSTKLQPTAAYEQLFSETAHRAGAAFQAFRRGLDRFGLQGTASREDVIDGARNTLRACGALLDSLA